MKDILDLHHFEKDILNSKGVILVDFWAPWCGPCKTMGAHLEELSKEVDNAIYKVNTDNNEELSAYYKVRSIPTLMIFKDGKKVEELVGVRSKEDLKNALKSYE